MAFHKLTVRKQHELDAKGNLIHQVACLLPTRKDILGIDNATPLNVEEQLDLFSIRIGRLMLETLGQEIGDDLDFTVSAVVDCRTVLDSILDVINIHASKSYSTEEKAGIARRSFGIVRHYAQNQDLGREYSIDGPAVIGGIEFIEDPIPYARVKPAVHSLQNLQAHNMPCPAFRGVSKGVPRMPVQIWDNIIEVYKACGELD